MIESNETRINLRELTDLEEYEKYLQQLAVEKKIAMTQKSSLRRIAFGGGITIAIGKSGRSYTNNPAHEPLKEIQYSCNPNNSPAFAHELTHVEQRLTNPGWRDTSLAKIEVEATLRALKYSKGLDYPITTFNLLFNLIIYLPIVGIEALTKK